uniref:Uncharacterized protein n=1 Tax=Arundo donax TaxID=35708 RepID=A0A0A9HMS1_ARUDO
MEKWSLTHLSIPIYFFICLTCQVLYLSHVTLGKISAYGVLVSQC